MRSPSLPVTRRRAVQTLGLGLLACRPPETPPSLDGTARLAELERRCGGRLGVAAWALPGDWRLSYREHERFPMCSTFKLPLAAAVLRRVDEGRESLARFIPYDETALLEYAPVSRERLSQGGMTVQDTCDASVTWSDNTAANLLLETLGGPPGLTSFFRSVGDDVSRLDRTEPMLNTALPNDERDTTTPGSMLGVSRQVLLGSMLREPSRRLLHTWLERSTTGRSRLRAGLPEGWRAGDKTGTGEHGATNDVAIAWQPSGAPLLIAAYSAGSTLPAEQRSQTLADVARIVTSELARASGG
jgi:beta-lactamase class A